MIWGSPHFRNSCQGRMNDTLSKIGNYWDLIYIYMYIYRIQWGYNGSNNLDTFWYSTLCELESMAYVVR